MEKKAYKAPEIQVYGDVKEITKSGGPPQTVFDATYPDANPPRVEFPPLS